MFAYIGTTKSREQQNKSLLLLKESFQYAHEILSFYHSLKIKQINFIKLRQLGMSTVYTLRPKSK